MLHRQSAAGVVSGQQAEQSRPSRVPIVLELHTHTHTYIYIYIYTDIICVYIYMYV